MKTLGIILFTVFLAFSQQGFAQVAINSDGSAADPSSMLDVVSSEKGVLVPRMIQDERDNIINLYDPAQGLLIFQTDNIAGFYYYNGTSWAKILESVGGGLSVPNGGTGLTSVPVGEILIGNGSGNLISTDSLHWNKTLKRLAISSTIGGGVNAQSTLEVNGSFATRVTTINANATLNSTNQIVLCNSTSPFNVTLPTASSSSGRQYTIKNINSGVVTIIGTVDATVNPTLPTQWSSITVISSGTAWYKIAGL